LIFPFLARIARLDTESTTTTGGYDHDFRSVKHSYPTGALGLRVSARRELAPINVPCQVEVQQFNDQELVRMGSSMKTNLTLVIHMRTLEQAGLINADRSPKLNVGDRLVQLFTSNGALAQPISPNVYAVTAEVGGFGLGNARNLLMMRFEDREQGPPAGGT
jgi:hypothetical protein